MQTQSRRARPRVLESIRSQKAHIGKPNAQGRNPQKDTMKDHGIPAEHLRCLVSLSTKKRKREERLYLVAESVTGVGLLKGSRSMRDENFAP